MRASALMRGSFAPPHGPIFFVPLAMAALLVGACQPTVRVEAPQEPITINLNVKLDADVRVRLEEQAQEDIAENDDIF